MMGQNTVVTESVSNNVNERVKKGTKVSGREWGVRYELSRRSY